MDHKSVSVSVVGSEISKEEITTVVDGPSKFTVGEIFNSYDELIDRLDAHSQESFVHYWRRDSRTVEGAYMKTSRPIAEQLKYYSMKFACVYGGQKFFSRGLGQRQTQTMRTNCPAHIQLRATKSGQQLEVISVINIHNHYISEEMYKSLPQDRRLPSGLKAEIKELLRMNIDRQLIKDYIRVKSNKEVTSKDLFNISASNRKLGGQMSPERVAELQKQLAEFLHEYGLNLKFWKVSKPSKRKMASHKSRQSQKLKASANISSNDMLSYLNSASSEYYNEFKDDHQTGKLITENDIPLQNGFDLKNAMEFEMSTEKNLPIIKFDLANEQELSTEENHIFVENESNENSYQFVGDLIEEADGEGYVVNVHDQEFDNDNTFDDYSNEMVRSENNIDIEITDFQNGNGNYLHGEVITPNFDNFVVEDNVIQVDSEHFKELFQRDDIKIEHSENSEESVIVDDTQSDKYIEYSTNSNLKLEPLSTNLLKNKKILKRNNLHSVRLKSNKEICGKCLNENSELISQNYKLRQENDLLRLANEQLQVQLNLFRSDCYVEND